MKIGLDLDDVIIDHTQPKIRVAKEFGYLLKPHDTPGTRMKIKLREKGHPEHY